MARNTHPSTSNARLIRVGIDGGIFLLFYPKMGIYEARWNEIMFIGNVTLVTFFNSKCRNPDFKTIIQNVWRMDVHRQMG